MDKDKQKITDQILFWTEKDYILYQYINFKKREYLLDCTDP